jgi:crossover junction endodeoxyribonuclease RusA
MMGVKAKPALRGEPVDRVRVRLPWPPSNNNYYAVVRGRKVLGRAGRAYREAVALACMAEAGGHVTGRVRAEIFAYPKDRRRFDLDNLLKAILDAAQHAGLYADDSQIDSLEVHRCGPNGAAGVVLILQGGRPGWDGRR